MRNVRAVVLAASIPLLSLAAPGPAAAEDLITGTATYELSLDASKGTAISSVSGRMIQSIPRNCDSYEMSADLSADLTGVSGAKLPLTMKSTSVEDERTLTFDVTAKAGPIVSERARGTATKNADGVTVVLTAPAAKTIELEGDALFPAAMARKLVSDAKAGKRFATYHVFDGGGHGSTVWSVSAAIGVPESVQESNEETEFASALGLAALQRWPMRLSYFPSTGTTGEPQPAFAADGVVYANGFTSAAVYDYGQFAFRLTLVEFTPAPPTPCS